MIDYIVNNYDKILKYSLSHIELVLIAILLSCVLWISIGILIRNSAKKANGLIGVASIIMSIPSISLYGIFVSIPFLGLSKKSAILALVLYAMLPLIRNVYIALNEVDEDILEAARGIGLSKKQILFKVQLPLAVPVIFAGLRVAVVMMIGVATLAVYIGERNLGTLIQQGISMSNMDMILTGGLIVAILSILVDIIMGLIQKKLMPKGLKVS